MTNRDLRARRATIKLLVEHAMTTEIGSLIRAETTAERVERIARHEERSSRAGAMWVARHRGLQGRD